MKFDVWLKNTYPQLFLEIYPQYQVARKEYMNRYKRDYYRKKYGKKIKKL